MGATRVEASSRRPCFARYAAHRPVSIPPGTRQLSVPPRHTDTAKGSPIREKGRPCPFCLPLQQPEHRPYPRVPVAQTPTCPHGDEAANHEDCAGIEPQGEQSSMLLFLLREAKSSNRPSGDVSGKVQQRRQQKASEERAGYQSKLVYKERCR